MVTTTLRLDVDLSGYGYSSKDVELTFKEPDETPIGTIKGSPVTASGFYNLDLLSSLNIDNYGDLRDFLYNEVILKYYSFASEEEANEVLSYGGSFGIAKKIKNDTTYPAEERAVDLALFYSAHDLLAAPHNLSKAGLLRGLRNRGHLKAYPVSTSITDRLKSTVRASISRRYIDGSGESTHGFVLISTGRGSCSNPVPTGIKVSVSLPQYYLEVSDEGGHLCIGANYPLRVEHEGSFYPPSVRQATPDLNSEWVGPLTLPLVWYKLNNYSFRVDDSLDMFRRLNNRDTTGATFGLELEVSSSLSTEELQRIVTMVEPKQKPFFVMKSDGSISGRYKYRYEIVTVPATPRYLRHNFKVMFEKIESLCEKRGLSVSDVFDTSNKLSNGLHIHLSRDDCFNSNAHISRLHYAINTSQPEEVEFLNRLTRRPSGYLNCSYARRSTYSEGLPNKKKFRVNSQKYLTSLQENQGRYSLCNVATRATVELRLFQGVVDLNHLLACIDFSECLVELTAYQRPTKLGLFLDDMREHVMKSNRFRALKGVFI